MPDFHKLMYLIAMFVSGALWSGTAAGPPPACSLSRTASRP